MFAGLYEDLPPPSDASEVEPVKVIPVAKQNEVPAPKIEPSLSPKMPTTKIAPSSTTTTTTSWSTARSLMPQSVRKRSGGAARSPSFAGRGKVKKIVPSSNVVETLNKVKKLKSVVSEEKVSKEVPVAQTMDFHSSNTNDVDVVELVNPYDPSKPNDYEKCLEEKKNKEMEDSQALFGHVGQKPLDPLPTLPPPRIIMPNKEKKPVDLHISGEEAWRRRAQMQYK